MGISGLLPALKSIQVTKHLSEYAGQTIGVDAYVWLHRGIHTCAIELATGKETHKYVDYAMHRVRLLRHHHIEPYIVFDGGPLPAKRKTEDDRKQRRDENLARANMLAAQGKYGQARDHYIKCVDVTPQMAFQLIKALRAESVPYVVAPYEADAQLAYLERIGLVDGILTEDSDLLVFGCRNALFKLDTVANTVVSISRKDFGSVCGSDSDISLVGWSDTQFRAMAILSGCDYLPSIPGIGLKTACSLLRKWKTAEQVIKAILLEGKKAVPRKYAEQFKLAEKCFLHQRVYCPESERLVHLNDVDEDLDTDTEAYCGSNMDSSLAKSLAKGDVDPVTLLPMKDIHPGFSPRTKPLPLVSHQTNLRGKAKAIGPPSKDGNILSFFGPNTKVSPKQARPSLSPSKTKKISAGKASGKRTLVEVMDGDIAIKRRKQKSKFFATPSPPQGHHKTKLPNAIAGPSHEPDKENAYIVIDDDDEEDVSCLSARAQGEVDAEMEKDLEDLFAYRTVEQEDGYISPTPSYTGEIQDLSSPVRPCASPDPVCTPDSKALQLDAEVVSSPPSAISKQCLQPILRTRSLDLPQIQQQPLAQASSWPAVLSAGESFIGPDLRDTFNDSDIDCSDDNDRRHSTPTVTPPDANDDTDDDLQDSVDGHEMRTQAVVTGWRQRWALGNRRRAERASLPNLVRRETNVTPSGWHSLRTRTAPNSATKISGVNIVRGRNAESRRRLPFCEA